MFFWGDVNPGWRAEVRLPWATIASSLQDFNLRLCGGWKRLVGESEGVVELGVLKGNS